MKKKLISLILILAIISVIICAIHNEKSHSNETDIQLTKYIGNSINMTLKAIEENTRSDPYEVALQNMQSEMAEIEYITDKKEWYLAYKNIIFKYFKWLDPPETVFDYFTEDEVRLICKAVETECYQQEFDAKVNVASVIFNRYYSGEFGETIEDIITSENQFAYGRDVITADTILSVMYAFEIQDTTNGALFFHSNEKTDTFYERSYIFTDDATHNFY